MGSRMKNVVLFCFPFVFSVKKKVDYTRGSHSRSGRSTLLRSIQCLARFLVTANGYGSDSTRFTTFSLHQAGSVCLSAVCVLHFHLSLLVVFTPATKSPPLPLPRPRPRPALIIYYYCAFKKLSYLCQAFVLCEGEKLLAKCLHKAREDTDLELRKQTKNTYKLCPPKYFNK